jgi:hypothetical protein
MHRVLPAFCASPPAVLRPLARKALKVLDEERFLCKWGGFEGIDSTQIDQHVLFYGSNILNIYLNDI